MALQCVARRATFCSMGTWTTFTTMISDERIRIDILEADGIQAGWLVRHGACQFHAYVSNRMRNNDVTDLMADGVFLGNFEDSDDAHQVVLDALGITDPVQLRVA